MYNFKEESQHKESHNIKKRKEANLKLATVDDDHIVRWLSALGALLFNLLHKVHSVDDSTENDVLSVEPLKQFILKI